MQQAKNPRTFLHDITEAVEARLRLGFPATIFQFTLMADNPTTKELNRVVAKKPFLGLGLTGLELKESPRRFQGKAHFNLFLITQNNTGMITPNVNALTSYSSRYIGDEQGIGP
jgi:hypothetical protein